MKVAAGGALALALLVLAGAAAAQSRPAAGASGAAATARAANAAKAPARAASAAAASAAAGAYAQRFAALCAACHGANGRSEMEGVPVIAGQPSLYAITQLFLYREGRRSNEAMTAVAKTLNDDDMRGFADHIGTLPPVAAPPPSTPPDAARMSRGRKLAQDHKCVICHGADFAGGEQVPRIAGQREDYLKAALQGFRTHTRAGYTRAMAEALNGVPADDLDVLAYYAARFERQ